MSKIECQYCGEFVNVMFMKDHINAKHKSRDSWGLNWTVVS